MLRPDPLPGLIAQQRAFLRFVEKRVGDRATAEDILQDAFSRAVERAEGLREGESAVAWFYRMLRNAVVDHYRRKDASRRALESFARELEAVEPANPVHEEVCACLLELAGSLKPEYADALREVELGGRPLKDYAEARGITANNAGVRVHRARQALRRQVFASCHACADHGCVDCSCRRPSAAEGGPDQ